MLFESKVKTFAEKVLFNYVPIDVSVSEDISLGTELVVVT